MKSGQCSLTWIRLDTLADRQRNRSRPRTFKPCGHNSLNGARHNSPFSPKGRGTRPGFPSRKKREAAKRAKVISLILEDRCRRLPDDGLAADREEISHLEILNKELRDNCARMEKQVKELMLKIVRLRSARPPASLTLVLDKEGLMVTRSGKVMGRSRGEFSPSTF